MVNSIVHFRIETAAESQFIQRRAVRKTMPARFADG